MLDVNANLVCHLLIYLSKILDSCGIVLELLKPLDLLKLVSVSFRIFPDLRKSLTFSRELLSHQSQNVSTSEFSRSQQKTDCLSFFKESPHNLPLCSVVIRMVRAGQFVQPVVG